jgi:hypothetical protein
MAQIDDFRVDSLIEALTIRSRIHGIPVEHEATSLASYFKGLISAMANEIPEAREYLAQRERIVREDIARIVDITAEFK